MKTAIRESHLSLRGITVTYADGHTALAPTSLEVQHGGFLVLLGASGAGKSTLLRSINGLVSPTDREGTVADSPADLWRRCGLGARLTSWRRWRPLTA